jgi:hypothetical protein
MGGYAYAADNPVSQSDPTGLSVPGESICTESVNCNGSGDGPPSGWSGPGTANWNYTGTGMPTTTTFNGYSACERFATGCTGSSSQAGPPTPSPVSVIWH